MKLRNAIAAAALGVATIVGLTACSPSGAASTASMSPEATALTALGFTDSDVTDTGATGTLGTVGDGDATDPSAAPTDKGKNKHPLLRRLGIRRALARNVLHGEVTVTTKNGDKVIEVQRGTVTAINATTITVKSTDGFVMTWTFGTPIHVVQHRTTIQATDVAVGTTVGVAGTKDGSTDTAKLIVIPAK
jgi:hypothetical protein